MRAKHASLHPLNKGMYVSYPGLFADERALAAVARDWAKAGIIWPEVEMRVVGHSCLITIFSAQNLC